MLRNTYPLKFSSQIRDIEKNCSSNLSCIINSMNRTKLEKASSTAQIWQVEMQVLHRERKNLQIAI